MKKEINLNLGCGVTLLKGFINIDHSFTLNDLRSKKGLFRNAEIQKGAKFIQTDMRKLPFHDNYVDYIECLEAIEHIPYRDVEIVIKEMYRVLKPGGKLVMITTDFEDIAKMFTDNISEKDFNPKLFFNMVEVIYGNQLTEGEYHRSLFTPRYMWGLLQACGFNENKFKLIGYPRGAKCPKFKGAKWPNTTMFTGMLYVEAIK